jgi:hypothetical protein
MKKIKSNIFIIIIVIAIVLGFTTAILDSFDISLGTVWVATWNYILEYWYMILGVFASGFFTYMFNEFEDKSIKNGWKNPKWNTANSWKHKWAWKDGKQLPYTKKWYYFGIITPQHKEAFFYSSTALVWLTDKEHLFQMIKFKFIFIAILLTAWPMSIAWSLGKWTMSFLKEWLFQKLD